MRVSQKICSLLGVLTGYNTLSMAMTLPPDGKVVACEVTDKYMKDVNSQQYFKEVRKVSSMNYDSVATPQIPLITC